MYLKDTNPYPNEVGQIVTGVEICIFTEQLICYQLDHALTVDITNCSDFNVYYLRRPPEACDIGYCFGNKEKLLHTPMQSSSTAPTSLSVTTIKDRECPCLISGTCIRALASHPQYTCLYCQPEKSTTDWTRRSDFCIIDGTCVTSGQTNAVNPCEYCNPDTFNTWTAILGCGINNICYFRDSINPRNACQKYDPSVSLNSWTDSPNTCQINGVCYKSGDKHPTRSCQLCNPYIDRFAWSTKPDTCHVSGKCYQRWDIITFSDHCYLCDPTVSNTHFQLCPTTTSTQQPARHDPHQADHRHQIADTTAHFQLNIAMALIVVILILGLVVGILVMKIQKKKTRIGPYKVDTERSSQTDMKTAAQVQETKQSPPQSAPPSAPPSCELRDSPPPSYSEAVAECCDKTDLPTSHPQWSYIKPAW